MYTCKPTTNCVNSFLVSSGSLRTIFMDVMCDEIEVLFPFIEVICFCWRIPGRRLRFEKLVSKSNVSGASFGTTFLDN